ncbi:condensation domain-containing protein [Kitasatospora brasiliensis]|uniref:condensation domain-containing protein n=1 Tax=Kitasatospora brasiliensis TaxID=3058040 RepID=UPI00292D121F|nr:condensation domain-containing protein [Kitasatospora sp. K002]
MRTDRLTSEQQRLLNRLLDEKGVGTELPVISPWTGDRTALPLSFAQQRIWFFDRLQPSSTLYNTAGAARLRGPLDIAVLQRCLDETVRRHEVLRSTYRLADGASTSRVNPPAPVPLPVVDLSGLPDHEREQAVVEHCRREVDRPFDLEHDLMLRPLVLRLAEHEHLLLLSQHHIATDGWSLGVLLREIGTLYTAFATGLSTPLPEPGIQYGDFAVWQRDHLAGSTLEDQLSYWRRRLAGAKALDLPTGRLRPAIRSWDGGSLPVALPPDQVKALTALGESERATPFMVLLAAVSVVFSRWSGQEDLVIGVPVANRNLAQTEALVGCFVNTLPVRMDVTGSPTFRELLRRARQEALDGYANQDVPFEKIIEEVNPEREVSAHTPLIRHMLGLHNTPSHELTLPGLGIELEALDTGRARFDLEFELSPAADGGLTGRLWYASDLFARETVQSLLSAFQALLSGALADPDAPVVRLPMLTAEAIRHRSAAPEPTGAPEPTAVPDGLAERVRGVLAGRPDPTLTVVGELGPELALAPAAEGRPPIVVQHGGRLTAADTARFALRHPRAEVYQCYSHPALGLVALDPVPLDGSTAAPSGRIPLRRALGGLRLEVLDGRGEPVPDGVAGELCVGGPVRPAGDGPMPGETFPDPFRPGARLLRTGDRARRTPAGPIELLGRYQGHAVVRGRPLEPGDLTAELAAHHLVDRARTTVLTGPDGSAEPVVHLTLAAGQGQGPADGRRAFVSAYTRQHPEEDPVRGGNGWTSPRTGERLTAEAIREWVDGAANTILELGPRRVLEIGCRTGLLLFRLAPRCESYCATDLSARALKHIDDNRHRLAAKAADVKLLERAPDDLDALPAASFDTVVVNSLVGYIPDADYLERVLHGAIRLARPGGAVYVADVPALALAQAALLPGCLAELPGDTPAPRVRTELARRAATSGEFAVDPAWFREFAARTPEVSHASALVRTARQRHELNRHRYDVILHRAEAPTGTPADGGRPGIAWRDAGATSTVEDVVRLLTTERPALAGLRGVPDAGLAADLARLRLLRDPSATATVADLREIPVDAETGVDPVELAAAAAAVGYRAAFGPTPGTAGRLDVLLRHREAEAEQSPLPSLFGLDDRTDRPGPDPLVNDPGWSARARTAEVLLRNHLRERLPSHAVPRQIQPLPYWPLDSRGRLDTAALPVPAELLIDHTEPPAERDGEPGTATEREVARIWSDVLGADRIGVHDDFFALGGHSLIGAEVIDRLRGHFAIDLPLGQLFETPTVAAVAKAIDELREQPTRNEPIRRINRADFLRSAARGTAPTGGGPDA